MKKNILLSGLGGSLFPYLHYRLSDKFNLFYVDSNEHLGKLYKDLNFFPSPLVKEESYIQFIKKLIQSHEIDYYIPLIDEEIYQAKTEVEGFNGVIVIAPDPNFCELCLNKYDLMVELKNTGISVIETFKGDKFNWEINLPIFIKPIVGRGSRGIMKIESKEQLDAYFQLEKFKPEEVIIQPYLEGEEYTVGVLTNNCNNLISISSKRIINKRGITQHAVTEDNEIIDQTIENIVHEFKPGGPFNVQLKIGPNGDVNIFEINPRFSTTTIMEYEGGIDLISNFIEYYDRPFQGTLLKPKVGLCLYRRWENIFYYGE